MKQLLGRPRTIEQTIHHRKISWLELFYDLVFAVVLARLTDGIIEHMTWQGWLRGTLIFAWFFWSWGETSGYFDNHGNTTVLNLLFINVQLLITAATAIFIPNAVGGDFKGLTYGLLCMQLMLALIWGNTARFDATHAAAARLWSRSDTAVLVLLLIAQFLLPGLRLPLLIIAILCNYGVIFIGNRVLRAEYESHQMPFGVSDSLLERFGLLAMIALGELLTGLISATPTPLHFANLLEFILGGIFVALIAGIYYQVLGELHVRTHSPLQSMVIRWLLTLEVYFIMVVGILLTVMRDQHTLAVRGGFALATYVTLLIMWVIQRLTQREENFHAAGGWFLLGELLPTGLIALVPAEWTLVLMDLMLGALLAFYLHRVYRDTDGQNTEPNSYH